MGGGATVKKLTYSQQLELDVKQRIKNDLSEHTIKVIQSDGFHRHWVCRKPGTNVMWFDVITWPGVLCIRGDMGTYAFSRTEDMLAFMRSSCMSYSYAAEKCVARDRDGIDEFKMEVILEHLDFEMEDIADTCEHDRLSKLRELKEIIEDIYEDSQHEAYQAMSDSGLFDCDYPEGKAYTYQFLWNLHAIKWLCERVKDYVEPVAGGLRMDNRQICNAGRGPRAGRWIGKMPLTLYQRIGKFFRSNGPAVTIYLITAAIFLIWLLLPNCELVIPQ